MAHYRLVARLGQGGMAEVFLAAREVAPFSHQPVVIKRLHRHFSEDPSLVQMFLDEARLLCLLDHPQIVKTIEAGIIEGHCCIALEYLEGQPLHHLLRRAFQHGKLPIEVGVSIALSVLEALEYAHNATDTHGRALEIVHRDISPHNVFVTNQGQVKVLDFGIAKSKTQEGRTATGIVKGKVGYIAPEQARSENVDRRADLWSTGVVLWEALVGTRLFKGDTDAASLNLTLTRKVPPAPLSRPEIPIELDLVLARALLRDRALRYQSASAMHHDLTEWLVAVGHRRNSEQLAGVMQELFAVEIADQRRLVSALMARSDSTPSVPTSTRSPSSTSAQILTIRDPTSIDLSNVSAQVDEFHPRHRRANRFLFALSALFLLVLLVASYSTVKFLEPKLSVVSVPSGTRVAAVTGVSELSPAKQTISKTQEIEVTPALSEPRPNQQLALLRPRARARTAALSSTSGIAASRADLSHSFGLLNLDTSPWSIVRVGDRELGQTPLIGAKLASGPQVLSLRNPELGIDTTFTVTIEAGKTLARRIGIE